MWPISLHLLLLLCCYPLAVSSESSRTVTFDDVETPLVSLLMPVDLTASPFFVEVAISHARRQTYRNIQIIVVDDGTAPRHDLIKISDLTWVRYEHVRAAKGASLAERAQRKLALALEAAQGSIIVQWDEMEVSKPSRVEAQVRLIISGTVGKSHGKKRAHAGCVVVCCVSSRCAMLAQMRQF
jgi:hypothetical protein